MRIEIRSDNVLIEGYVNAVARDSRPMRDKRTGKRFVEQIVPGVFKRALSHNDVQLLLNHESDRNLGSTQTNLELEEDNIGLHARAVITDSEVIEKARKKKLRGWSFGFRERDASTEEINEHLERRYVEDMELVEVSIIDDRKQPCYEGTSLEVRAEAGAILTPEPLEVRADYIEMDQQQEKPADLSGYNKKNQRIGGQIEMRKKAIVRKDMQLRAENLKNLTEQRADLVQQMKDLVEKAEVEKRAFSAEEDKEFDELEKKVKALDSTIEKMERARDLKLNTIGDERREDLKKDEVEERAFAAYLRGEVLERADINLTAGDNGAVIPTSIARKIIQKVYDICPIYQMATRYNVGGTLSIPYYDEDTQSIEMSYATEFAELESTSGKFASIELKGFLAGALSKVSKSLVNNSQFDIVSFVVNAMAKAISRWIEKELLNGTADKIDGLRGVTQTVTTTAPDNLTLDELIDLQETIPDVYQGGCVWIMNKATRTRIRKMKDEEGNYILNKDATSKWGYTLFGKDVYTSDRMPKVETKKTVVYYGDMSGLAVKLSEDVSIEVLREKYATQHAIGVVGWIEIDAKVEDAQKIAKLVMA